MTGLRSLPKTSATTTSRAPTNLNIAVVPYDYDTYARVGRQASADMDDQLSALAHATFYDFDVGEMPDVARSYGGGHSPAHAENGRAHGLAVSASYEDEIRRLQFSRAPLPYEHFGGFHSVAPAPTPPTAPAAAGTAPPETTHYYSMNAASGGVSPATSPLSPNFPTLAGDGRNLFALPSSPSTLDESEGSARRAAEEDKRRRNTAASARFRVKKKLREQELEKSTKELTQKVSVLEAKITQYEMENKWLRGLVTEKAENKGGVAKLCEMLATEEKGVREEKHTTGVGTEAYEKATADE